MGYEQAIDHCRQRSARARWLRGFNRCRFRSIQRDVDCDSNDRRRTTASTADQTHGKSSSHSTAVTAPAGIASVDTIKVSKCYTNGATQLLIKASSSDPDARLVAYRPDGTVIGDVQNGGGGRYGGTVMPPQPSDPVTVTIRSSSGGSITVATTAFQPGTLRR